MSDPTVDDPGGNDLLRLFQRACALEGDERARMLAELEERDAGLASELRELLAADEGEGAVPQRPTSAPIARDELGEAAAGAGVDEERLREEISALAEQTRGVGRYRVGDALGEGGMGRVQRVVDRPLRRELAMKTIRRSGGRAPEPALLARFLTEARILGKLDHPGIVSVHELGVDADGNAYFTMPVVQGGDLSAAFAQAREGEDGWSLARAVGVLQRVCEAMAHAHANGVVHRDLKPSNVMVGRFGEVQVMDWGIARVRGERDLRDLRPRPAGAEGTASQSPVRTMDGAVVGTPYFMSPEQGKGSADDVDERSDVYAVGAMLYELLAGRRPYEEPDGDNAPYAVLARLFERDPEPLSSIAPESPAELVAVCEKAMARDRAERYANMEALAGDLRAFLENRVVQAHRTGAVAELVKWTRRNRLAATALAAVVLSLVGGVTVIAAIERASAEVERELGEQIGAKAATVSLLESMIRAPRPSVAGRGTAARDILLVAKEVLEGGLISEPDVLVGLQDELASTFSSLGEYDPASELLSASAANLTARLGPAHPDVLMRRNRLADALFKLDEVEEAIELNRELVRTSAEVHGPYAPTTLDARLDLGLRLWKTEDYDEGGALVEEVYRWAVEELGPDAPQTLRYGASMLPVLRRLGRHEEALEIALARLESLREPNGELTPSYCYAMGDLGSTFSSLGRYEEAEEYFRASFDGMMRVLGADHEHTYYASFNLGGMYERLGRLEEAREQLELTLENRERLLPQGHDLTLRTRTKLGRVHQKAGRWDEAQALWEANHEIATVLGTSTDTQSEIAAHLGRAYLHRDELRSAQQLFEEADEGYRRMASNWGPQSRNLRNLILTLARLRDVATATDRLAELLELVPADQHPTLEEFLQEVEELGIPVPALDEG